MRQASKRADRRTARRRTIARIGARLLGVLMSDLSARPHMGARMNFSQFVATGATAVVEGAVLERLTRDPAVEVDPHILNGGLIYDARGRALLAEIYGGYARSARKRDFQSCCLPTPGDATEAVCRRRGSADVPSTRTTRVFSCNCARPSQRARPFSSADCSVPPATPTSLRTVWTDNPRVIFTGRKSRRSRPRASTSCIWRRRLPWKRRSASPTRWPSRGYPT